MPPRPHRPAVLARQVFRGSDVIARNLLTEHQLRSSAWVRLRHDVYADARLERDHGLACRAAALRLPAGVWIAGPSAAYLHGVEHAASFTDDVHVLVPGHRRIGAQQGIRLHVTGAPGTLATPATGHAVTGAPGTLATPATGQAGARAPALARTSPERAAWETAAWLDPVRAIGIIDALLGRGLTTPAALMATAEQHLGRPGSRRAAWLFGLADGGAQSAPESHLRLRLVLAGLPRPVTQHPVRLPCGRVVHPDLAWPEHRVAVEYDGQWHAEADRLHVDRARLNGLVAAGWLVLHVTSRRLHRDFPGVLREVRIALAARGWRR
ncbi:hypothetical protein [Micromonospora endolithica]|uniref:DUF559 domain-containing protein n=1 Tax=Micromonospora endolithica TaxID=230091 RepID=A0A3A9YUE6_9ACTN|nr:hypothetical protein [Micromonospora endolithica]RKN38877.1 hypothetical protein D7223_30030 [Micromonospora endolithica]TWJ25503.1 very-short-patch-repair endonuclease [Micromonospora endolithica]